MQITIQDRSLINTPFFWKRTISLLTLKYIFFSHFNIFFLLSHLFLYLLQLSFFPFFPFLSIEGWSLTAESLKFFNCIWPVNVFKFLICLTLATVLLSSKQIICIVWWGEILLFFCKLGSWRYVWLSLVIWKWFPSSRHAPNKVH